MNIYKISKCLALSAVALGFAACSDSTLDSVADDAAEASLGIRKLQLSLGGGVTVGPAEGTRGTNLDFQNSTFVPDYASSTKRIGIFIVTAGVYDDMLAASDRPYSEGGRNNTPVPEMAGDRAFNGFDASDADARLIAEAYRDGKTYGYENVLAYIHPDGSIRRYDGLDFIYPIHGADSIAVMAYAPYNDRLRYEDLKSGMPAHVLGDQSTDFGMLPSDMLFGVPSAGNPLREDEGAAVSLAFRHVMSSVRLTLNIGNTAEYRSDSIIVRLRNVACADTLLPMLAAEAAAGNHAGGLFLGGGSSTGTVTMACVKGMDETDDDVFVLSCDALVVPQSFSADAPPVFEITFKGRKNGLPDLVVERTDRSSNVSFTSGKRRMYRGSIPADDGTTLPDDGRDDVILGSPAPNR